MQQTEKLKLNLIETGDPISPAPINENAEKIEGALLTKTDETRTDGLEQRVTALEAHKMAVGSYTGNNSGPKDIILGFTPQVVIVLRDNSPYMFVTGHDYISASSTVGAIIPNGFRVSSSYAVYLNNTEQYFFLALA